MMILLPIKSSISCQKILVEFNKLIENSIPVTDYTKTINLLKWIKECLETIFFNEKLLKSKQTVINSFFCKII